MAVKHRELRSDLEYARKIDEMIAKGDIKLGTERELMKTIQSKKK